MFNVQTAELHYFRFHDCSVMQGYIDLEFGGGRGNLTRTKKKRGTQLRIFFDLFCLRSAYFAEMEIFFVRSTINKGKSWLK